MGLKSIQILGITTVLFCFVCCKKDEDAEGLCKEKKNQERNVQLLLVDDGYSGVFHYRKNGSCLKNFGNGTNVNHSFSQKNFMQSCSAGATMFSGKKGKKSRIILSCDTNMTGGNCCGVEIQKHNQSYHIYLPKNLLQVNAPILCFLPGNYSTNWTAQTGKCEGAVRLNPCKRPLFKFNEQLCLNRTENDNVIIVEAKVEENKQTFKKEYVTCKNPVTKPKITIKLNHTILSTNGEVDARAAAMSLLTAAGGMVKTRPKANGPRMRLRRAMEQVWTEHYQGRYPAFGDDYGLQTSDSVKRIYGSATKRAMRAVSSLIKDLGNEMSAEIKLGPIKGILKKQDPAALKELFFGLNSDSTVQDIEDITALEETLPVMLSISEEAFVQANLSGGNEPFVAVFRFPNMTKDENNSRILNSEAIAIEMAAEIRNLTNPISLIYRKPQEDAEMSCSSWNGEGDIPVWTTDGCHTHESNDTITCLCTHLTFFAILMASPGMNISSSDLKSLTYITYIGCGLSMFFLGIGLFIHFLLRHAKANYTTQILMNLFLALFLLNLAFLSNEWVALLRNSISCQIIAAAMHYFMLSTFTWFAVEAFHLYFQLIKPVSFEIKHYIHKLCIAGWALPCVVTSTLFALGKYGPLTINSDYEISLDICWINDSTVHHVVNIGYYAIVFLFTFTVFIAIVTKLALTRQVKADVSRKGTGRTKIISILGLCCLLGITWGFAFLSHGPLRIPSYYIFTILNSVQGFCLFLYYYNTNKIVGEERASSSSTQSTSTIKTTSGMVNPYFNKDPKTEF